MPTTMRHTRLTTVAISNKSRTTVLITIDFSEREEVPYAYGKQIRVCLGLSRDNMGVVPLRPNNTNRGLIGYLNNTIYKSELAVSVSG